MSPREWTGSTEQKQIKQAIDRISGYSNDRQLVELSAHDGQPFYIAGPHGNAKRIVQAPERNLGSGNYQFVMGTPDTLLFLYDEDEDDFGQDK